MGLDKAISSGKEKRKPYHGSKSFDPSCRNHKGCPVCEGNRKHSAHKAAESARNELNSLRESFYE